MPRPFRADLTPFLAEFAEHHRGIRLGRMFGLPAGYVGRRLFVCLRDDGLIVRLPPDVAAREIARGARPFTATAGSGRRARWVRYRPKTAVDARRMVPALEIAARYVAEQLSET